MSHTLLLADDSETTHRVVTLMFAERGVRVLCVSNGQQAVERLSAEPPDIVLAAISLAKVDGYQLADFMQGQPQLRNVPVLLLSGAFDAIDEERVRQSGAAGVLVKPFESELVINRVKELLGFGGKPDRPVTPPGGRLFPQEAPPHRPSLTGPRGAGAPAARPDFPAPRQDAAPATRHDAGPPVYPRHEPPPPNYAVPPTPGYGSAPPPARTDSYQQHGGGEEPAQPAAWDRLREQSGLGPETAHVESGTAGGADDYFDRLDAAFDNLDAQLSGRSAARPRDAAPTTRRMPVPDEISTRRLPAVDQPPDGRRADVESTFEDAGWFNEQPASERPEPSPSYRGGAPASGRHDPSAFARPEPPASYGGTPPASYGETSPTNYGAAPPPSHGETAPANYGHAVARPDAPPIYSVTPPVSYSPPPVNDAPPPNPPPPAVNHAPPVYAPAPPPHHAPPAVVRPEAPASARQEPSPSDGVTPPPSHGETPPSYGAAPSSDRYEVPPSHSVAPPPRYAPVVRSEPAAPSFADAFDHMLAAEQGEAHPPADVHHHGPLIEISDEVIERIASRVAERLSEGVLFDTVTHIVSAVSERLIREEIARIRAAAQAKNS